MATCAARVRPSLSVASLARRSGKLHQQPDALRRAPSIKLIGLCASKVKVTAVSLNPEGHAVAGAKEVPTKKGKGLERESGHRDLPTKATRHGQAQNEKEVALEKVPNKQSGAQHRGEGESQSDGLSRTCIECHQTKLLVDFKKSKTDPDGRTDMCRACLAILDAKRLGKELGHLALSPELAWQQSKVCSRCKTEKELRDYPKKLEGTGSICRACGGIRLIVHPPTNTPLQCKGCKEVKPASEYRPARTALSGRNPKCKDCQKEDGKKRRDKQRALSLFVTRPTKLSLTCGELKSSAEYYRRSASRDGVSDVCKECQKQIERKWHLARGIKAGSKEAVATTLT